MMTQLTIYYDGQCPLCATEMRHLKHCDREHNIQLVDLHQPDFASAYPHIDKTAAMQVLHADYRGELLTGLDVTHRAWNLVGKGFWVAPLGWSILKPLWRTIYRFFARHRHTISRLFFWMKSDAPECQNQRCERKR